MAIDYTTLALVKAYGNNLLGTTDDPLLGSIITTVSRAVDNMTNQAWSYQTLSQNPFPTRIDQNGTSWIYTNVPYIAPSPLVVDFRDPTLNRTWQTLTNTTDIEIVQSLTGCKVVIYAPDFTPYRPWGTLQMRVTCNTGYASYTALPSDLEFACRELVWWIYKQREAPLGKVMSVEFGPMSLPTQWPKHILEIITKYKRSSIE